MSMTSYHVWAMTMYENIQLHIGGSCRPISLVSIELMKDRFLIES